CAREAIVVVPYCFDSW
nr:immunoglobulin heavy chain junction region [Macaca mulatta]MOV37784.1 immunoglobulin heavy chain junction region [Macaca mulatta]MOV37880.1 immunoglobulin heavy chain junction region [Macaca mulatta]MOV37942.1 immunoglobulin heavy chain junction region [Macaca mulatta]MOV38440.1 immunoglobulin heavy chain junction region [Macaca mulatta]